MHFTHWWLQFVKTVAFSHRFPIYSRDEKIYSTSVIGNHPDSNRMQIRKGLIQTFSNSRFEFAENTVESTIFNGETAVETSIFSFKVTPRNGGPVSYARGRSLVVYVRYKDSPTGWASIREMAQAAPDAK
jgi:hypothetical protein